VDPHIRREHHTADDRGPCPHYPHSRVTAQGEDLLAWLETAIARRESVARVASPGPWIPGGIGDYGWTVHTGIRSVETEDSEIGRADAKHIALNSPSAVLRRCAADRKLITLHNTPGNVFPDGSYLDDNRWCVGCGYGNDGEPLTSDVNDCPTLHALALGYGWTGGDR
jgi:hypothetical protein